MIGLEKPVDHQEIKEALEPTNQVSFPKRTFWTAGQLPKPIQPAFLFRLRASPFLALRLISVYIPSMGGNEVALTARLKGLLEASDRALQVTTQPH